MRYRKRAASVPILFDSGWQVRSAAWMIMFPRLPVIGFRHPVMVDL